MSTKPQKFKISFSKEMMEKLHEQLKTNLVWGSYMGKLKIKKKNRRKMNKNKNQHD